MTLQTWFIGQGLNDNQWHQVSISRRGGSIRLTIDEEAPVQGILLIDLIDKLANEIIEMLQANLLEGRPR